VATRDSSEFVRTASGAQLKHEIVAELHDHLDDILLTAGFRTSAASTDYRWRGGDGHQVVRNYTQYARGTAPRSSVIFLPQIDLYLPAIDQAIRDFTGIDVTDGAGSRTFTESINLNRWGGIRTWQFVSLAEFAGILQRDVRPRLIELLPSLHQAQTIQGFAELEPSTADRIFSTGRGRWTCWAVAKLLSGDLPGAAAVLDEQYPDRGPVSRTQSWHRQAVEPLRQFILNKTAGGGR
jgi:hypothetical protein